MMPVFSLSLSLYLSFSLLLSPLSLSQLSSGADVCPSTGLDICGNIDADRPRACTACIGVTIDLDDTAYLYKGLSKDISCILHGLYSNDPQGKWYEIGTDGSSTEITSGVATTTDTTQGTRTTKLSVTIGETDKTYSCKYTASDGFSVEDYIEHKVGDAKSTLRCEISSAGDYFNKFWGYSDKVDIISSSDTGYEISYASNIMSLDLDASSTWTKAQNYRCSASFTFETGAHKSVAIKSAHIQEDNLPGVVWKGVETEISVTLASINPNAETVTIKFGNNALGTGQKINDKYVATDKLTFTNSDEKSWTISAAFKYPSESEVTITEAFDLKVAELTSPTKFVCFAKNDCEVFITFTLSTIDGITSNGQTNSTNKQTVTWTYSNNTVTAKKTLTNVQYNDAYNTYSWKFFLQKGTELEQEFTLDVAEIVAKDLTVFDAYTTTVDYQFELKNSSFTPTACYVEIGDDGGDDKEVSVGTF
eukprot:sb/3464311/